MKYSCIDIETFFNKFGYKMRKPNKNYIESKEKNKLGFVLKSEDNEVSFFWQVKNGETLLKDKLSKIKKFYPRAKAVPGENVKWTRLFITLDKSKPLTSALEVLKKTSRILGYHK